MHRTGIQLSGSPKSILDKDPRPIIEALGIELLEIPTLHDFGALYQAYRAAYELARSSRPSMIYPVGFHSTADQPVDLHRFGRRYGIGAELETFAAANGVALDTEIWIPGSLMSFGDVQSMIECVFLVNQLPGGKGHHDGHMKDREVDAVLANPMLQPSEAQKQALAVLCQQPKRSVLTRARPAPARRPPRGAGRRAGRANPRRGPALRPRRGPPPPCGRPTKGGGYLLSTYLPPLPTWM